MSSDNALKAVRAKGLVVRVESSNVVHRSRTIQSALVGSLTAMYGVTSTPPYHVPSKIARTAWATPSSLLVSV